MKENVPRKKGWGRGEIEAYKHKKCPYTGKQCCYAIQTKQKNSNLAQKFKCPRKPGFDKELDMTK